MSNERSPGANGARGRKRHCRTCRCGVRVKRHVCRECGTRKLEKFMQSTGTRAAFGKAQWRCIERATCQANRNYR